MSSGTLPFEQYHRASHIGEGTFGAVVTVYNDDAKVFAMKQFFDDETTEEHGNDEAESEYTPSQPISIGTLRELSCLRLLRGENSHPNIIEMVDIQPKATPNDEFDDDDKDHEICGAGTSNHIGMALPLGKYGTLASTIQNNVFLKSSKSQKVHIAHGILSAIHYLHESCGIVHRDIKCDNILMDYNTHNDRWEPILIDFSLAKPISTIMWSRDFAQTNIKLELEDVQHTGEVGTLIYTAPEVVQSMEKGFYNGKAIDMYSIGVVLLELIQNHMFTAEKYKEALVQIQSTLETLPTNLPFPNLIRQLLTHDPKLRVTACDAIHHEVFKKFGIVPSTETKLIDIQTALPYGDLMTSAQCDGREGDDSVLESKENKPPEHKDTMEMPKAKRFKCSGKKKKDKKYEQRMKMIDRILIALNSDHPLTRYAAFEYSVQYEQLDDGIDEVTGTKASSIPSQSLIDCCILAHRFFELQVLDLTSDITDAASGTTIFQNWDYDDYIDNELTLLMILDYCLYPRAIAAEY